jgi:hypothetical protein
MINLNNADLIQRLHDLSRLEKKTTTELIVVIQEFDQRRLYLDLGHTSLYQYLTKGLAYSPGSAQRRIDAARMLTSAPNLEEALKRGELNLSQVSLLAQGLRLKKQEGREFAADEIRKILDQIASKDFPTSQKIVAQALDIKPMEQEKTRLHRDDSVRLELTLSESQMKALHRCRDLLSHSLPNANWAALLEILAEFYLGKKDPLRSKAEQNVPTAISEAAPSQKRAPIPAALRRRIHQRDRVCQWQISPTMKCGSTYRLEIDHIHPVWAGGPSCEENLQLLCSTHNRLKYEKGA